MSKFRLESDEWPGVAKVIEEGSELLTLLGKLIATDGDIHYFDGRMLDREIADEIADLRAALGFLLIHNPIISAYELDYREKMKLDRFNTWRHEFKQRGVR